MSLAALIARYKQPPVTPVTPVTEPTLPPQPLPTLAVTPVTRVTPKNTEGQSQKQSPDAMLAEIAVMLQADPSQLRALLSADDIQDIADGENSRTYMLDYFRLMRADGKLPVCTELPAKASKPPSHMESAKTWTPAHDRYISHVMACTDCRAPQRRYCDEGAQLRCEYWGIHQSTKTEESL
jgi:hypothetical protein